MESKHHSLCICKTISVLCFGHPILSFVKWIPFPQNIKFCLQSDVYNIKSCQLQCNRCIIVAFRSDKISEQRGTLITKGNHLYAFSLLLTNEQYFFMVYWMKFTHHYISGVSQINIQLAVSSRVCLAIWMLNFFVYLKNTKEIISIIYILHRKWNFSNHIDNVWWVQNYSTHILKLKFQIIYHSVDERVIKGMAIHT